MIPSNDPVGLVSYHDLEGGSLAVSVLDFSGETNWTVGVVVQRSTLKGDQGGGNPAKVWVIVRRWWRGELRRRRRTSG